MKPRSQQGLLRLALTNLLLYALDMGCALCGFIFGFGLTVHNWWAAVGFMILSRWVISVGRGIHDMRAEKRQAP